MQQKLEQLLSKQLCAYQTIRCKLGTKIPATKNGFKDAQQNDVLNLVGAGYNVGLACEASNLIAIDCDYDVARGYDGESTLRGLESKLGKLPQTLTQTTPRGGKHYIFSAKGIVNPIGKLSKDIDIKYRGYLMIWPSTVNGVQYQFTDGIEGGCFQIAELPQKWLDKINQPRYTGNSGQTQIYDNIEVEEMFNGCAFLQHCRDDATTLSEPEWFTMITVLAPITGSDDLIHQLSSPYSKYTCKETQQKIDQARRFGKSRNCAYISRNFGCCENCKYNNVKENNPINLGTQKSNNKSVKEFLFKNSSKLANCTFLNSVEIEYSDDDFVTPKKKTFLIEAKNKIYQIELRKGKKIQVKQIADFVVKTIENCKEIKNLLCKKEVVTSYYEATLVNSDNIEVTIKFNGDAKCDQKKFESALNQATNGFNINMNKTNFKEFISKFFNIKNAKKICCYSNPGLLTNRRFLYQNALIDNEKVYNADSNGYIKLEDNTYIKLSDDVQIAPILTTTTRSAKQVTKELIDNIKECWADNAIYPLVSLGYMAMSIYFPKFKSKGVPTLILFGETSTGKSTIAKVGSAIYGLPPSSLHSGGSTIRSWEYYLSHYNGMCVCIDDVKGTTLTHPNFTEIIKSLYQAQERSRMKNYGQTTDIISICSPLICSTNEKLPNLKEVRNRLNIVEMFGNIFNSDKFKYHESNSDKLKELSIILPELLKVEAKDVEGIYNNMLEFLEKNCKTSQRRVVTNLAYAFTGLQLLFKIAEIEINSMQTEILVFAQKQLQEYDKIEDVVDKVLAEIPILFNLGKLQKDVYFRIETEHNENVVYFHSKTLIAKLNECNYHDKSKYIDLSMFNAYFKTHKRFRKEKTYRFRTNETGNFSRSCKAIGFNIDGLDDYSVLYGIKDYEPGVSINIPF